MPCPFPGMDPYLEHEAVWPDFQGLLVEGLHRALLRGLTDRYGTSIGTRTYQVAGPGGPAEVREYYLEVRERGGGRLVTLLDVVSPANKATAQGREAYLTQRRAALGAGTNVAELDLVLQGEPTLEYSRDGLPDWDYAVTVTRSTQPERYEIYTATLQKKLPRFRLPLASDDRDTVLDLQAVFAGCHEHGGFSGRVDYRLPPAVPLLDGGLRWLDDLLAATGLRGPPPREEVALAAYYLWEREGRPHGRDQDHWHRASGHLRRGTRPWRSPDSLD